MEIIKNIDQELVSNLVFAIFSVLAIAGAFYVLITKNILHAAFGLLVTLLSVAAIFVFSFAEFVAVAQIMIYIGGILILLIFAIMLSVKRRINNSEKDILFVSNSNEIGTFLVCFTLVFAILGLVSTLIYKKNSETIQIPNSVKNLGVSLMTTHVLAVELVGLLLLIALIGATYISKKDVS